MSPLVLCLAVLGGWTNGGWAASPSKSAVVPEPTPTAEDDAFDVEAYFGSDQSDRPPALPEQQEPAAPKAAAKASAIQEPLAPATDSEGFYQLVDGWGRPWRHKDLAWLRSWVANPDPHRADVGGRCPLGNCPPP